jgi:hypothetical protein
VAGAVILELCGREVARQSLLFNLTGMSPGPWLLVVVAAIAAAGFFRRGRSSGGTVEAASTQRTRLLFAVLFAAGLAGQLHFGARLQSDGFYYFAYLRSITFDRDVEFSNDYRLLGLGDKPHLFVPTPTGYAQSAWTIGPAIVWSPFFAAGDAVASWLNTTNPDVSANGISFPYRQAVCVAGLFYALLGCWFCFRLTALFHAERLAAAATACVVLGSFMIWYIVKEPSMTHAPSMAAVAGFVWGWLATREGPWGGARTVRQWMWLGAVAGFMTLIRWQNALFAVLPACDAAMLIVAALRSGDRARLTATIRNGVLFTACATVAFIPQMIAWNSIYGSWLAVSPVGPQIRWFDPHLADILWSSRNGLLSWSPVLYLGAIGLFMFTRRLPALGIPMLLALALMTYFNASIQDWWGSAGFGGRRFDGTIPIFCLGLATFFAWAVDLTRRHPLRIVAAMGALLVAWNLSLMSAANDGLVRIGESISFGDAAAGQVRALHRWTGNPFTYPASLLFALRNGLPPARYDLLSANRFLGDPLRQYGRVDVGSDDEWLLEGGWHGAERESAATFRWAASPATILVPLDHAAPLTVQVRLHAFGYPGAAPQTVSIFVNGRGHAPMPVSPGWETLALDVEEDAWRAGVNRVRLDFAWTKRPMDVGLGGDARPLAAAVDYLRVAVR